MAENIADLTGIEDHSKFFNIFIISVLTCFVSCEFASTLSNEAHPSIKLELVY